MELRTRILEAVNARAVELLPEAQHPAWQSAELACFFEQISFTGDDELYVDAGQAAWEISCTINGFALIELNKTAFDSLSATPLLSNMMRPCLILNAQGEMGEASEHMRLRLVGLKDTKRESQAVVQLRLALDGWLGERITAPQRPAGVNADTGLMLPDEAQL